MNKIELLNEVPQSILDAIQMDKARQRFLYYTDKLSKDTFSVVNYSEDNDKLCYSESLVYLKMGSNLYLGRRVVQGFTFDKKTKKVRI